MRIVFMGTPDFAVPSLQGLIDDGHEILAVYTQPDKPVGRKQVLTPPPVKALALEHGLPVYQPTKMRDGTVAAQLRELAPDLIAVVAYGRASSPKEILEGTRPMAASMCTVRCCPSTRAPARSSGR